MHSVGTDERRQVVCSRAGDGRGVVHGRVSAGFRVLNCTETGL